MTLLVPHWCRPGTDVELCVDKFSPAGYQSETYDMTTILRGCYCRATVTAVHVLPGGGLDPVRPFSIRIRGQEDDEVIREARVGQEALRPYVPFTDATVWPQAPLEAYKRGTRVSYVDPATKHAVWDAVVLHQFSDGLWLYIPDLTYLSAPLTTPFTRDPCHCYKMVTVDARPGIAMSVVQDCSDREVLYYYAQLDTAVRRSREYVAETGEWRDRPRMEWKFGLIPAVSSSLFRQEALVDIPPLCLEHMPARYSQSGSRSGGRSGTITV